eukprot:g44046.t1
MSVDFQPVPIRKTFSPNCGKRQNIYARPDFGYAVFRFEKLCPMDILQFEVGAGLWPRILERLKTATEIKKQNADTNYPCMSTKRKSFDFKLLTRICGWGCSLCSLPLFSACPSFVAFLSSPFFPNAGRVWFSVGFHVRFEFLVMASGVLLYHRTTKCADLTPTSNSSSRLPATSASATLHLDANLATLIDAQVVSTCSKWATRRIARALQVSTKLFTRPTSLVDPVEIPLANNKHNANATALRAPILTLNQSSPKKLASARAAGYRAHRNWERRVVILRLKKLAPSPKKLAVNSSLTQLSLWNNKIGNARAIAIGKCLEHLKRFIDLFFSTPCPQRNI